MDAIKGSALRLGALALVMAASAAAAAEDPPVFPPGTFFAVDVLNRLERYNVAAPSQRLASVNITGLAAGEDIQGLDFRPANGALYGVGSTSQLYRIDPLTGIATRVGVPFAPTLDGVFFGVDFNPAVDRLRVVSSNDQNLRLHPDTGAVSGVDGVLNPSGDVMAAAYINNFHGATATTLYDLDSTTDQLLIQSPPNNGALTAVGPLGVDFGTNGGFDVAPNGTAYAALAVGAAPSTLYTVNLATGAASAVGPIGVGAGMRSLAFPTGPEIVYGVTASNRLIKFSSHTPGTLLQNGPIGGLQPGENVLAIDFRPATGELYALGSSSRLYRIDPATAVATAIGAGPFTPALAGSDFGFDFNPTVDRIRLVSDAEQNLRLHPDLGTVAFTDTSLTPTGNVVAAAYTNNFAGAVSTTLFDIDSGTDLLLTQNPPNNGQLNPVGPLGVDAAGDAGLDIAPDGTAYASFTVAGVTSFHTVNLATGAATSRGPIGAGEVVRDIAIRLQAEVAYAVIQQAGPVHNLLRFNTATPGVILSSVAVSGLQGGENLLGIDVRPATGQLYALGSTSRVYVLDPATGTATQQGSGPLSTPLAGSSFGFDFNPTADRLRIVSDTEQNLRVNPYDLALIVDGPLSPPGNVTAAAYINNYAFATGTTLYDIDWVTSTLLMQNPPNTGTLVTVGPLGIVLANPNIGFDVGSISGHAYLASSTAGAPQLHRVNLASGAATSIGTINATGTLVGFAVAVPVDPELTIFEDGFE
jgi:hypothetical protein